MSRETSPETVVYGAGAIGGVIAARLTLAGVDVTAVARGRHLQAIRANGLTLRTQEGSETVGMCAAADAGEVDWSRNPRVILAVKSQQTSAALDDLSANAPADTAVFVAQNGIANESAVLRRFADVYAVNVMLPAAHLEPGVVVQQCHPVAGILDLGRFPTGRDQTAAWVSDTFDRASFVSEIRDDIIAWKYRKLIANLGNGVMATYLPGPEADELVTRARLEAETILEATGIPVIGAEQDRQRRGNILRGRVRDDYFGSTWQSVARGRADVETDYFNGEIVLQARLHAMSSPVNELIQRATAEHARRGQPPRSRSAAAALTEIDRVGTP